MKRICLILSFLIPLIGYSQTNLNVSGVINNYYAVTNLVNGTSTVTCTGADLSDLNPGDKIVLIQMTGGDLDRGILSNWPLETTTPSIAISGFGNVGHYEFLSVLSVDDGTDIVTFTANFKRSYDATNEKVQLVKLVEADFINVTGAVNAQPWNGTTGGVVAMVAYKKVELNAAIDVSNQGYRGANPISNTLGCRPANIADTFYFKDGTANVGGLKGEGVLTDTFTFGVGMGAAINGGGGASGYFGGGAGGSNYNGGGQGGLQLESCTSQITQRAQGGFALGSNYYDRTYDTTLNKYERWAIAMGGGGGSSNEDGGNTATPGGNGGGIIIILTDTLDGNDFSIMSNGESVTTTATAGGGGGGAGGTVILDASNVSSAVTIEIAGGKGGNTETNCSGAGGGGAGGVYWYNNGSIHTNVTVDSSFGGLGQGTCTPGLLWGSAGEYGVALKNYEPILNGFSFNALSGIDTICQGQQPIEIYGSTPKGEAPFTFQWYSSSDNSSWTPISGATGKNFQPGILNQTTYYTRDVTDGSGAVDRAISVWAYVWDSISNNELQLRDTLCFGAIAGTLNASASTGGNGSYSYVWESRTDASSWTVRSEWNDISTPDEASLTETTYYRRTVNSAKVCTNTSAADTLTILPSIQNNIFIDPDTTICENLDGGILRPESPSGGDNNFTYSWLSSADDVAYSPIAGTDPTLSVGNLSNTTYFKRVVYSGNDDACKDTTAPRIITVLPSIAGNNITSDSTRYCFGDTPNLIIGGTLSGGNGTNYQISWWQNDGTGWIEIIDETAGNYQPGSLTDSLIYRRRVVSGDFDACIDTSNTLSIDVIPEIVNNLVSSDENICENSQPLAFSESSASEGAGPGTFEYLWLEKPESSSDWSPAAGTNNSISYAPAALTETTLFSRRVMSHICADTSNEINIVVYPKIENNSIAGGLSQFTCFNTAKDFTGSTPTGGQPSSTFNFYWESSPDQIAWTAAAGSPNSKDYTTESLITPEYFRRMVTSGELEQCQNISDTVYIDINPLPTGFITDMIDTLCSGTEIVIDYTVAGNGPWTIEIGESTVLHTEAGIQNTSGQISFALNESADIKVLSIQDDSLCFADLSGNTGLVEATVYEWPVANAGEDFEACGLTTQMKAVPSVGVGLWTTTDGNFTSPNSPGSNVEVTDYIVASFTWTETNWRECVDQDVVLVEFWEQPTIVDAGEDIELRYEFETQLNGNETDFEPGGRWSFIRGQGSFEDSTQHNTFVTVSELGEYSLQWTITNGVCAAISDSILLTVLDIELYGGFSPNDDGVNDIYEVNLREGEEATLIILDRHGNRVRTIDGVSLIQWDGTNEGGEQVKQGTYFYILKEAEREQRTGYIEIRR